MFHIDGLCVSLDDRSILSGVSLSAEKGTTHVLMGPNGSGKSTLACTIMGHPRYECTTGAIRFDDKELQTLPMHLRAQAGIFVGFQHPMEIPGVSVMRLLTEAYQARFGIALSSAALKERIEHALKIVKLPLSYIDRSVNVGFSGGEKKRLELAQMIVLKPSVVILDEIDSGLDIDGLHIIGDAIKALRGECPEAIILMISHNTRIKEYLSYDRAHIMKKGTIIASGQVEILEKLERGGYEEIRD